jgi:hypothetical protein
MKYSLITVLSALVIVATPASAIAEEAKKSLCTAKDVQHNIDTLRQSISELKSTHDTQRGMQMLHDHMTVLIDNQEIMLGLLDKKSGVACPKPYVHIR